MCFNKRENVFVVRSSNQVVKKMLEVSGENQNGIGNRHIFGLIVKADASAANQTVKTLFEYFTGPTQKNLHVRDDALIITRIEKLRRE